MELLMDIAVLYVQSYLNIFFDLMLFIRQLHWRRIPTINLLQCWKHFYMVWKGLSCHLMCMVIEEVRIRILLF